MDSLENEQWALAVRRDSMPITLSFDIEDVSVLDPNDRTRIQVAFLRFGWEHLGGSCWRYPRLGAQHVSEDWLNHVIPALMYFRSIVEHSGMNVGRFTIDAHSEAGYRGGVPPAGAKTADGNSVHLYATNLNPDQDAKLSERRLRQFVTDAAQSLA